MNLLISEIQLVDAVLDDATVWIDGLDSDLALVSVEPEISEWLDDAPSNPRPFWFQPRLSALRSLIVGL